MKKSSDPNKIDLSGLNKSSRKSSLPPFGLKDLFQSLSKKKKVKDGRDELGRFAPNSGGLLSKTSFNLRRAVPVVAVVAAVGGVLVFRSFANTNKPADPPAYQYSIHRCSNKPITASDVSLPSAPISKCVETSAEALAYRIQLATLGRQTDSLYKSFTQRLAGNRHTTLAVAKTAESTPEHRWGGLSDKVFVDRVAGLATPAQRADWTKRIQENKLTRAQLTQNVAHFFKMTPNQVLMNTYRFNNQQFIDHIFRKLLKRGDNYTAPASNTWLKDLNAEKITRAEVIDRIARSQEARGRNRVDVVNYVNSKPKLQIDPVAQKNQNKRINELARLTSSNEAHWRAAVHHKNNSKSYRDAALNKANNGAPNDNSLDYIRIQAKQVRNSREHANGSANNASKNLTKAKRLLSEAKTVTKRSPDISSARAVSYEARIRVYAVGARNQVAAIDGYRKEIEGGWQAFLGRYNAEKKRIAE